MFLIAGLGNPGTEYQNTRHNIGFLAVDELASRNNVSIDKKKGKSLYIKTVISGKDVVLVKPMTYMNLSGNGIREIADFYSIPINNVIIIHDDIDLPFNVVRVKKGGGHGGHNGIRNIVDITGKKDFIRIKAGVDRPPHPNYPVDKYVLSNFNAEEKKHLDDFLITLCNACEKILISGVHEAMNEYNGKNVK